MSNTYTHPQVSFQYGDQTVTLAVDSMASQATASILASMGDTQVLVTLVAAKQPNPTVDFLPLTVNYQKRDYATGKIPANYFRREGRPSEIEILISRLTDRFSRPSFPKNFYYEVQIVETLLSSDPNIRSDIPAMLGAAAALALSGLPCHGPLSAARIGYIDGQYILNPNATALLQSELDLVVAGTEQAILMVESEANALKSNIILEAMLFGHTQIQTAIKAIEDLKQQASSSSWTWEHPPEQTALEDKLREKLGTSLDTLYQITDKSIRKKERELLYDSTMSSVLEEIPEATEHFENSFKKIEKEFIRSKILEGRTRIDGREAQTIRPITIKTNLLPRAHGSALFERGETKALVVATLGTERDAQLVEGLDGDQRDSFMLHYNFPPYCVGEIGQVGSPKRREIGHGNLAKRALRAVLPNEMEFPYVLRIVSEIMSSNGSSSMATVCGTSLALMDAGVPLKTPVAGIAMGLIKDKTRFAVLSDISGDEDHIGDMDFKVAGTKEGITALQMDIKTDGITREILEAALNQATQGIEFILDRMNNALPTAREKISLHAPQIVNFKIPVDKIQALIGKGGATIRAITAETGTLIDIHRDTGLVRISTPDAAACQQALERIKEITAEPPEAELGATYQGKVVKIIDSGAFVSILPGRNGFLHISEVLTVEANTSIRDALKEKQTVVVKVLEIDRERNRVRLTMKGIETTQDDLSSSE